jgi:hypothetical protein
MPEVVETPALCLICVHFKFPFQLGDQSLCCCYPCLRCCQIRPPVWLKVKYVFVHEALQH